MRYHASVARSIKLDVIVAQSNSELEYKKNIFVVASGPGAERVREYTATVDSL